MKSLPILFLLLLTSCASSSKNEVVMSSKELKPKTLEQKKIDIKKMIAENKNYDAKKKERLEEILITAINKSHELRVRESQLIQQITNYTIVEKGKYDDLVSLKKELKQLYKQKYKNFEQATNDLKKCVGISLNNQELLDDERLDMFRP